MCITVSLFAGPNIKWHMSPSKLTTTFVRYIIVTLWMALNGQCLVGISWLGTRQRTHHYVLWIITHCTHRMYISVQTLKSIYLPPCYHRPYFIFNHFILLFNSKFEPVIVWLSPWRWTEHWPKYGGENITIKLHQ